MKSIICLTSSSNGISFIFVILVYIPSVLSGPPPCGLYGAKPCQFLPAPPGQTPACARPGRTYCEHIDNYPTYLIKHLVHKWGYEAKNLLIDETWDDFATLIWHGSSVFYDQSFIFPHQRPTFNGGSAHGGAHGGSGGGGGGGGGHGADFAGYNYGTPTAGGNGNGGGKYAEDTYIITKEKTTEPPTFLLYSSAGRLNKNQIAPYHGNLKVSPNNPTLWLRRIVRDLSVQRALGTSAPHNDTSATSSTVAASPNATTTTTATSTNSRDVSINMDLYDIVGASDASKARLKRQSPGRSTLCQTSSQFVTPQAALNSKGNWMFVVNDPSTARQMVKAELCASSTCSNLCQLPLGYNSRCEQKFAQKRLIALQANGQNLYTDTFWFPSCCVCTISAN